MPTMRMQTDIVLSWGLRVRVTRARAFARLLLATGSVEKVLALGPAEAVALGGGPRGAAGRRGG